LHNIGEWFEQTKATDAWCELIFDVKFRKI